MVMHSQQIEEAKKIEYENNLWWEMDKIAVKFSERVPESTREERLKKANAAEAMMGFLHKPTPEWCRRKYDAENAE